MIYERHAKKFDTDIIAFILNDDAQTTDFIITAELTRDTFDIVPDTVRTKSKRIADATEQQIMAALLQTDANSSFAAFFEGLGVSDFIPIRMHTYYVFEDWYDKLTPDNQDEFLAELMETTVKKLYRPYEFLNYLR